MKLDPCLSLVAYVYHCIWLSSLLGIWASIQLGQLRLPLVSPRWSKPSSGPHSCRFPFTQTAPRTDHPSHVNGSLFPPDSGPGSGNVAHCHWSKGIPKAEKSFLASSCNDIFLADRTNYRGYFPLDIGLLVIISLLVGPATFCLSLC